MNILKRSLLLLGVTAFTLTACKDDDPVAVDTIAVTNVTVTPSSGIVVNVGSQVQLSATVVTNDGTGEIDRTVTWSATPTSIATVNASTGVVTGVNPGNATVTARSNEDNTISGSVSVEVRSTPTPPAAMTAFNATPDNVSIVLGGSAPISTNPTTANASVSVSYVNTALPANRCAVTAGANPTVSTVAGATVGTCVVSITATATGTGFSPVSLSDAVAVTVTAQPVALLSLTVTPNQVFLAPGGTQALQTITTGPATSVTYSNSSSNNAVATVSGGANPTITAGATNGTAQITIRATGSGTGVQQNELTAVVEVSVQAASVSISSVTTCVGGPPCVVTPVLLAGALGQIEATLNIESGNQQIGSVVAEMGSPIAGSCTNAGIAWAEAASQIFGINGAPDAPVTLNINTAEFDANFVPKYLNGEICIRARVIPTTGTAPNASNTVKFTLVNPDVVYFNSAVATTGGALGLNHTGNSAVGGGNTWWRGGFTYRAHPVLYSGAANVVSITYTSSACGANAGAGPTFAVTFSCAGVQSTQNLNNAVTITYVAGYTLTVSPTTFMTAASAGFVPGKPVFSVVTTREDNVAPSIVAGNVAFNDSFDQMWVNASYAFLGDFTITDGGVGVNAATRVVRVFGTPNALCSASNAVVVTGADLSETLTSDGSPEGHRLCAAAADLLGNANAGSGATNFFGVDKGAPSVRLAGSTGATPLIAPSTVASVSATANTTIYGDATPRAVMPATDVWGLEAIDTRSGFNQNAVAGFPAVQTMSRLAPAAPTSCGLFTNPMPTVLSDNWVRVATLVVLDCAQGLGYYNYSGHVVDRAGNPSTAIVRNFARDHVAAPVLASIGLLGVTYPVGQPADFFLFGSDDLEIIEADITVSYPNAGLAVATIEGLTYALPSVGGGARWDLLLNNSVLGGTITVPSLLGRVDFTCTGVVSTPYANCPAAATDGGLTTVAADFNNVAATNDGQNPDSVRTVAYDVASNVSNSVATGILTAQTTDVAQQWVGVGADLINFRILSTAGGQVIVQHTASTSITAPYFDSVILARGDIAAATELRVCGVTFPAPVLSDNGVNRFWTYTVAKPGAGHHCTTATGNWYAIGIKNGAALVTVGLP